MKKYDAFNVLAEIRDYVRALSKDGEIPQFICDDFNHLAAHINKTGGTYENWCIPKQTT